MPIYAYKCTDCGFEQDVMQKVSDAPLSDCPQCGKPSFAKQLTAAGFQLKGNGYYVTDFKNGQKPAAPSPACGTGACPACTG
ncbi:MAG: FmdB family zinc ribbon protein [Pseudomonadota bacterium]